MCTEGGRCRGKGHIEGERGRDIGLIEGGSGRGLIEGRRRG